MKKLLISMIILSAVFVTGCRSTGYSTMDRYEDRRMMNNGFYGPGVYGSGVYGPNYYRGGYYPNSRFYGSPFIRRQPPVIIYQTPPPNRVIRQNNPRVRDNRVRDNRVRDNINRKSFNNNIRSNNAVRERPSKRK